MTMKEFIFLEQVLVFAIFSLFVCIVCRPDSTDPVKLFNRCFGAFARNVGRLRLVDDVWCMSKQATERSRVICGGQCSAECNAVATVEGQGSKFNDLTLEDL
jgi:hypothetical protein